MEKVQMQFTISEKTMNSLRQEAEKLEITPNVLARIRLSQIYGSPLDNEPKTYVIRLKNWSEVEAYAEERGMEIGALLNNAAKAYMKKNRLSAAQKALVDRNIEKREKTPANMSAGPL